MRADRNHPPGAAVRMLRAVLNSRWGALPFCGLAAAAYAAVFLANGHLWEAVAGAAIMLGYGILLFALRRRSEAAALLGGTGGRTDERGHLIQIRSAALSSYAMVTVALAMSFIELALGRNPGDWAAICAVGGGSFILSVTVLSRRT